jgi:hypothetical protein
MDFHTLEWKGVDALVKDRVELRALVNTAMSFRALQKTRRLD